MAITHTAEVSAGKGFEFGKNWRQFLTVVDDDRIRAAEQSLSEMLRLDTLTGRSFLDAGCGSGLFSLAARRLGARVHSFDYDPQSVACTRELKHRFAPEDDGWTIDEGSVLDAEYIRSLGHFDIVYSWGVLHHTARMWEGLAVIASAVGLGGRLFVSIYNDQGPKSAFYRRVKRIYCSGPTRRAAVIGAFVPFYVLQGFAYDTFAARNPVRRYTEYRRNRGMSIVHDWLDWLGGYPYEVAKPEEVFDFLSARGFKLLALKTTTSHGVNQFVLQREM